MLKVTLMVEDTDGRRDIVFYHRTSEQAREIISARREWTEPGGTVLVKQEVEGTGRVGTRREQAALMSSGTEG